MSRKFWVSVLTCVVILSMPLGGVAAQSPAPARIARLAPPGNLRAFPHRPTGKLSFRLQALADSPQLRLASAEFQAQTLSLPASGPGSLIRDQQGRILVDIRLSQVSDSNLAALSSASAQIVHVSNQYRVATALVGAADLSRLALVSGVESIMEEYAPLHASDSRRAARASAVGVGPKAPTASTCPVGTAVSEGDVQLRADLARTTYSVNGAGVKVGILSDSYDRATSGLHAADDVASGDLPGASNTCGFTTPVAVISDSVTSATDEGRAMLQIVHDLAPGAQLAFASSNQGLFQFADNIRALRTWGADVIADDVAYFVEPFFQEGPVAVAAGDVITSGAVYLTAAANSNAIVGGNDVTSYEAPAYRPAAVLPVVGGGYDSCHDFNPLAATDNTSGVTLDPGGSILLILDWNQPWYGVTTDLDLYVTDASNISIIASSFNDNTVTQVPFEVVSWSNLTGVSQNYNIEVCRFVGGSGDSGTPRIKWVMLQSAGLTAVEYPTSSGGDTVGPTIFGHSASLNTLSVAAAPYNDNNNPETYSSRGPATHYFGPVLNTTPAGAITPVLIQQPDFTATDGGCTTFFGAFSSGCDRFYGTSAAAPHAAAVVALLKQKSNLTSTIPINQSSAKFLLQQTARSMSGGTLNSVGSGLIDALGAIAKELLFVHHLFLPDVLH